MADNYKVSKAPKPITPLKGIGQTYKSKTIPRADYETWCKHDLWTIERGILLLLNAEQLPSRETSTGHCTSDDEQQLYEAFLKIWRVAESSLQAGTLNKIGKELPSPINQVLPAVFVSWAQSKGYQIPAELNAISPVAQAHPSANGQPDWSDWLSRNHLDLHELLLLSLEENPDDKDLSFFDSIGLNDDETYNKRRNEATSWIKAGLLQGRRVNNVGSIEYEQINPVTFFTLAESNKWDLAQEIIDFLHEHQSSKAEVVEDGCVDSENKTPPNEKELKQGLRDIWVKEGRPEMKLFFPDKIKKYINKPGSPITAVYTSGKDAGISFKLSTGTTGHRTKKTISNYVTNFKKTS